MPVTKPALAVWKFASCDGCQLSLLSLSDELLTLAGTVDVAYFLEASKAVAEGPYDLSLVEGSVTTPHDAERIQEVRQLSRTVVTIGACATAGGIQALRNFADVTELAEAVYPRPEELAVLASSTPISDHIDVDYELRGCPVDRYELLEVVSALLNGRRPRINPASVCLECKRRGIVCVMVREGIPCLGPITHAGCGALCPAHDRGCYGCYGPSETTTTASLADWWREHLDVSRTDVVRALRTYNAAAPALRAESERHDAPAVRDS